MIYKSDYIPENKETKYIFAVGAIKVKELQLLSFSIIEKIIETEDIKSVLDILKTEGYFIEDVKEEENILTLKLQQTYNFIFKLIEDKEIINLFILPYELHNLKILVKNKERKDLLFNFGIPKEKLEIMIKKENFNLYPESLNKELIYALKKFNNTPKIFEVLVDKAYYNYFYRTANIPFLKTLSKIYIDLYNILSFIRFNFLQQEDIKLNDIIIPNGEIETNIFLKKWQNPLEDIQKELIKTDYKNLVEKGLNYLKEYNSFLELENGKDKFVLDFVKKAKYVMFGIEPIIGFLLLQELELKNLRIILVGKKNNVPKELIKERIRK